MSVSVSQAEKVEPNLTPLLDMVLQLVMFFMLCANFVMEQSNMDIKLPDAIAARALDSNANDFVILNVDAKGVTTVGKEAFETPGKVAGFLRNQNDFDKARAKPADWAAGKGRSIIILRADKGCNYKQVHDVMQVCRKAGYLDVQLRTLKK